MSDYERLKQEKLQEIIKMMYNKFPHGVTPYTGIPSQGKVGGGMDHLHTGPITQSVEFQRNQWKIPEARKWLLSHGYQDHGVDLKPHYIHFRQYQPDHSKYHFVTQSLPNGVHLILEYPHGEMSGSGLTSLIKKGVSALTPSFLKPYESKTNKVKKQLEQSSDDPIVDLKVARLPVQSGVQKVLNTLSLGKYGKVKKDLDYNNVYHNYLLVTTASGKTYRVERNHVEKIMPAKASDFKETYDVPLHGQKIDLKTLVDRGDTDAVYDARKTNCQQFVQRIIQKNGLESGLDEKTREVVEPQNAERLINSLGVLSSVPKLATDVANVASHTLGIGAGVSKRIPSKRLSMYKKQTICYI